MRKHNRFSIVLFLLFQIFFNSSIWAQNCDPDIEAPILVVANPLVEGITNGDTIYYQCGEQDSFFENYFTVIDNCDPAPSLNFSTEVNVGNCASDGFLVTVEYCWQASDAQGNTSKFCFHVIVVDEVGPSFDFLPADLTIDLAAGDTLPPLDMVTATDECQGSATISLDLDLFIPPDSCGYILYRIWSAIDNCGNETSHTQIITAEDQCVTCPSNIIEGLDITAADCQMDNGAIVVEMTENPEDYFYTILPNAGVQNNIGNEFSSLPANDYEITVTHQDIPDCQAIINTTAPQLSCNDTLDVSIVGTEEYCVPSTVFDFNGEVTSSIFCAQGSPATVLGSMADSVCLTLVPNPDFFGQSPHLICIVHCFDNDPSQCDSTYLSVTVVDCQLQLDSVLMTPTSCTDDDGVIEIFASGQNGSLNFEWSPMVSTSNIANTLTSTQDYSVTMMDDLGCSLDLSNINVGTDCISPNPDTIALTFECGDNPIEICANSDELTGLLSPASICQLPTFGSLTAENDSCFIYEPNPDFEGLEMVCIEMCDDFGICDTFIFEITVEQCPQQFPCVDIPADTLFAQASNCDDEIKFCIEFPLGEILDYEFEVNGQAYSNNLSICGFDTLLSYGFSAIPGNGMNGPYELTSWIIDGNNIGGGTFQDVFELIDLMNMLDLDGNWALDTITFNISSFNTLAEYGPMSITQQISGDLAMLNINSATAPTGSALYFPVGVHEVIMTHTEFGFCVDTFTAFIHCAETQVVYDEILVGEVATYCPDNALPGQVQNLTLTCSSCENTSSELNGDCIDYQGITEGTDSLLMVVCDEFGFCDSTWLIVTVIDNGLPLANIDHLTTNENVSAQVDVLDNDFVNGNLVSIRILIDPTHGLATINPDQTFTFSPDRGYCGLDAFAYEICNEVDCDTSAVEVEVICTQPEIFTGFSPNDDGINDVFKITNLNHYPNNELRVFNRWGTEIYHQKNYGNNWDGRDFDDSILPDGTYFYFLDLGNGDSVSGYVQIHR